MLKLADQKNFLCDNESQTIAIFESHSNLNGVLIKHGIYINDLKELIGKQNCIKIINQIKVSIRAFQKENDKEPPKPYDIFFGRSFKEAKKLIQEKVINSIRGNNQVMDLVSISTGIEIIAGHISGAVIKAIKNRFDNKQFTAFDIDRGMVYLFKLKLIN